jgi:hypothetical protein
MDNGEKMVKAFLSILKADGDGALIFILYTCACIRYMPLPPFNSEYKFDYIYTFS